MSNKTKTPSEARAERAIELKSKIQEYLSSQDALTECDKKTLVDMTEELNGLRILADGEKSVSQAMDFGGAKSGTASVGPDGIADIEMAANALKMTPSLYAAVSSTSYKTAFFEYLTKGEARTSSGSLKVLQEGSDGEGGFTVPEDYESAIIQRKPAPFSLQARVRSLTSNRDNKVLSKMNAPDGNIFSSVAAMANAGEVPPNSASTLSPTPTFSQVTIPIFTYTGWLPLSLSLQEDSASDMEDLISTQFANYYGLVIEKAISNGSGTNEPLGVATLAAGSVGSLAQIPGYDIDHTVTTAVGDATVAMPYSIPPQYSSIDRMAWAMNKQNSGAHIATLKSTTNEYLFAQGYQDRGLASGRPQVLSGYEVAWAQFLDDMTSSGSVKSSGVPVIFGDWSGYGLIRRVGFSVRVLDQPLYTQNQVQVTGRFRIGGSPLEEWKFIAGVLS